MSGENTASLEQYLDSLPSSEQLREKVKAARQELKAYEALLRLKEQKEGKYRGRGRRRRGDAAELPSGTPEPIPEG